MSNQVQASIKTSSTPKPSFTPAHSNLLQRKCACGGSPGVDDECEECRKSALQRKATSPAQAAGVPPVVHDVLHSPGHALDPATRAFMEPRFGHDFSQVRVHTDARAAESARVVNALAYTVGRDVVLGAGQYKPETMQGRWLMAHELTHVVQQAQSTGTAVQKADVLRVSDPKDRLEAEAETQAMRVMGGNAAGPVSPWVHGNLLQRATTFFPGVAHNHKPTHDWSAIARASKRRCGVTSEKSLIECVCATTTAAEALEAARLTMITARGLTLANKHVDHYLSGGGVDYPEDAEALVKQDEGVRNLLRKAIRKQGNRGHFRIGQDDYKNEDFKFAFGAIDRLDYEVLGASKKKGAAPAQIHVWFKDRYEWHPEDTSRPSNCVHKAAVELKDSGAADYWMVGDATMPLSVVTSSTPPPAPPSDDVDL